MKRDRNVLVFALLLSIVWSADAQEPALKEAASSEGGAADRDELSVEQGRLADRYQRLEEVLGQLAEFSAATDPNRARVLREAIARSREQDINVRFESIVKLLEDERLSAAASNQAELRGELEQLLTLLLKADRDQELESERDRVRKQLKEVSRLIRRQKSVRARTTGGDDEQRLAGDQQRIADDTAKLGESIKPGDRNEAEASVDQKAEKEGEDAEPKRDGSEPSKDGESDKSNDASRPATPNPAQSESAPSDGEQQPSDAESSEPGPSKPNPSPSQPGRPGAGQSGDSQSDQQQEPADRAAERLQAAQQQMEEARRELDEAKRARAAERQSEALAKLEQAKAELERVLRQLREEEMERMLTQLTARFRKMLELQNIVYDETVRLNKVSEMSRGHEEEIEAARLSRQEKVIAGDADKALILLREEGSSVAFPEAVGQMRDDMEQVALWLSEVKVGDMTQVVERDIIEQLEETIAALETATKELEKNRTPPGQPAAGQPPEPPLVHKLAELKLIRSQQVRINRRTQRYAEMIGGNQAETDSLLEALGALAEREESLQQATYDLSKGLND
jgi:hypothetical protein